MTNSYKNLFAVGSKTMKLSLPRNISFTFNFMFRILFLIKNELRLANSIKTTWRARYKWVFSQVSSMAAHTLRKLCAIAARVPLHLLHIAGWPRFVLSSSWPAAHLCPSRCAGMRFAAAAVAALMKTTSHNQVAIRNPQLGRPTHTDWVALLLRAAVAYVWRRHASDFLQTNTNSHTWKHTITHSHTHTITHSYYHTLSCQAQSHLRAITNSVCFRPVCLSNDPCREYLNFICKSPPFFYSSTACSPARWPNWNVHSVWLLFYMLPSWPFARA